LEGQGYSKELEGQGCSKELEGQGCSKELEGQGCSKELEGQGCSKELEGRELPNLPLCESKQKDLPPNLSQFNSANPDTLTALFNR